MKVITLNTWGGRAGKEVLLDFFERYSDVDIFCLQEVWSASYDNYDGISAGGRKIDQNKVLTHGVQEISKVLSNHQVFFRPHFLENYGLAIFVKKDISVLAEGEMFVHKHEGFVPDGDIGLHARNIQYVTVNHNDIPLTVINFHGLWNGKGKTDSEERILQSKRIIDFVESLDTPVILTGDFNLLPETESISIIEGFGLRNLIKEYNIKSTRTSLYDKEEKYADYTFVSKEISVNNFSVLTDVVSDHSPLFIDLA